MGTQVGLDMLGWAPVPGVQEVTPSPGLFQICWQRGLFSRVAVKP